MSWSGLGNQDWVSFTNIQGSGLTLRPGQFAISSPDWMRKSELLDLYFVNVSNIYLSPKGSFDWIAKRDITVVNPIYITIASSYDGGSGLTIEVLVSSALPADLDISFEWCTDSGAEGTVTFNLPINFSGTTDALANLSTTGPFTGTYATGNVIVSSGSTVNAMGLKIGTLTSSTTNTDTPMLISYSGTGDSCGTYGSIIDECLENC